MNARNVRATRERTVSEISSICDAYVRKALGGVACRHVGQLVCADAAGSHEGSRQALQSGTTGDDTATHFRNAGGDGQVLDRGASGEGRLAQVSNGRGEIDGGQGRAICEGFLHDLARLAGDGGVLQSGATVKRALADLSGGRGKGSRVECGTTAERTVGHDRDDLGEGGGLQRGAGLEHVLAQGFHVPQPRGVRQGGASGKGAGFHSLHATGDVHVFQGRAIREEPLADDGHLHGELQGRKGGAVLKGIGADFGYGGGDEDGLEDGAIREGAVSDALGVAQQGNYRQAVEAREGLLSDLCGVVDGQLFQPFARAVEQMAQGAGGFGGFSHKGNGQLLKCGTSAQDATLHGGYRRGDIQAGEAGAVSEGIGLDLLQLGWQRNAFQTCAGGEGALGQGFYAVGNGDIRQGSTAAEGACADLGEGGGKLYVCQLATSVKGVRADHGELLGQTDGLQLGALIEGVVADLNHRVGQGDGDQVVAPVKVAVLQARIPGEDDALQGLGDLDASTEEVSDAVLAVEVHTGVGSGQGGDGGASCENAIAHIRDGVGDHDLGQLVTSREGFATYRQETVGKGDLL